MRFVWKEVLASLVAGRKPGEETTLWIQREVFNPTTGRNELEALHQIPVKVLEAVSLKEHTTDHQFALKIYNSTDEFVFRCSDAPADSMMWVQTLKKYQQIAKGTYRKEEEEKKGSDNSPSNQYQQQQQQQHHVRQTSTGSGTSQEMQAMGVRDLRAICHGAGINTAGMERTELERAAEEVKRRGTYFAPPGAATAPGYPYPPSHQHQQYAHAPAPSSGPPAIKQQQQAPPPAPAVPPAPTSVSTAPAAPEAQTVQQKRLGIKELRAICHGAGINTVGMERPELEAAAEEVQKRGTYFDPPPGMYAPTQEEIRARDEEFRKQQELRSRQEELRRRQEQETAERQRKEAEEARRRAAAAAEEEARLKAADEARRRVDEEARRRAAEEHQRRMAAEEQIRRQHEAQARYQQQQAAWRKQQEEEENRRRAAEQQAAEQRRRHEEAMRKQQQWASSQQQQQQQQWNQAYGQQHHQQNAWNQQQQQRHYPQQQPQPNRNVPPPQQQQQHHPHTAADEKYAKMANQSQDGGQAAITRIKHGLLIQWALQPPQLQMLRPIDGLITSIHQVFPPALGVKGHDYFSKWTPIAGSDLAGPSGLPDEEKLKKSVRKIRFFLHPDKLPNDLNEEQQFMTKMLWDVTSDAWEEYQKHREDLDWVKN
jgi:hypothetical protein